MDPLFVALSLFRRRKYKDCEEKCNEILRNSPSDQVITNLINYKKYN